MNRSSREANPPPQVTHLLDAAGSGDVAAQRELFDLAYVELKRIARGALHRSGGGLTVNPTSLVHEAYMKIAQGAVGSLNDSRHFYSLFARAMRQVLLDISRQHGTVRHGAGQIRAELTERLAQEARPLDELIQIDSALRQLEAVDPELAEIVEWHFFAGLSFVEIAAARGVTERTVRRHWELARAFLLDVLPGLAEGAAADE
jgi:RNA polymerase sigma factor (TIGR02999 family)